MVSVCWLNSRLFQDHRVVVRIDSWESTSLYPNGHSVRVLGRAGEMETEVQTILIENCIHVPPFSDAQVREEHSHRLMFDKKTPSEFRFWRQKAPHRIKK